MRLIAFLATVCVAADLKAPRMEAKDYPVQQVAGRLTLAAEYLVRGIPGERETFFTPDYLVVEVAAFPANGSRIEVSAADFTLRLNGKIAKTPETPQMVAASLKYDDWSQRPHVEASAGVGDAGVVLGRPRHDPRFPGDPTTGRMPTPPKVENSVDRSGQERTREHAHDAAVALAFPSTTLAGPERGYLYFAYDGKTKALKKLELIYRGSEGEAVLKLR